MTRQVLLFAIALAAAGVVVGAIILQPAVTHCPPSEMIGGTLKLRGCR